MQLTFLIRFYRSKAYIKERIQSYVSKSGVTAATARKIATGKRPQKYSKEDISAGAVLRAISPKAFNLIRKKGWMQLPARRTAEEWLKNFSIEEGLQKTLVNVVKAKHPEPAAREVFLSFDEMAWKERWVYDKVDFYFFIFLCIRVDFTLKNARVLRFRHGRDNGPSVADHEAPGGEWFQG